MEELEKAVSLVRFCRAHVIIENIVLNMMHDNVVESVKAWRDADEGAHDDVQQMLTEFVVWLSPKLFVLSIVHHENKSLHPG